ncbi:MAG: pirin family protein [Bacteroidetes bacterium]|nr:pirin family protein [Bacteroidota bacterium]MBL0137870.1 pirin family protein [Bacteroidota bacterium]
MSEPLKRRSFISRVTLGLVSAIAVPFNGISNSIKESINPEDKKMNPIKNIKPLGFMWDTADPFLFCVHHEDKFPKGNAEMGPVTSMQGRNLGDDFIIKDGFRMYHGKKVPGFPGHPHRGFETITVVRQGIVDHADSMGAAGRYGNGDVQWMTAGKGVQHSEMFPLLSEKKENPMELFQIWLNLPKKNKMVEPHFKMLWQDMIPRYVHKDNNGKSTTVEVIAGKIGSIKAPAPPPDSWAATESNEVAIWNIKMNPGAVWTLPKASAGINRTVYFYEGESLNLAGTSIPKYNAVELEANMDVLVQAGDQPTSILLLQGKPIGETVIQYGPFVMNTKEEINQAFEDYHRTQFGGWPWPRYDQVHPREKSRFAKHADGKEEVKSS